MTVACHRTYVLLAEIFNSPIFTRTYHGQHIATSVLCCETQINLRVNRAKPSCNLFGHGIFSTMIRSMVIIVHAAVKNFSWADKAQDNVHEARTLNLGGSPMQQ